MSPKDKLPVRSSLLRAHTLAICEVASPTSTTKDFDVVETSEDGYRRSWSERVLNVQHVSRNACVDLYQSMLFAQLRFKLHKPSAMPLFPTNLTITLPSDDQFLNSILPRHSRGAGMLVSSYSYERDSAGQIIPKPSVVTL